VAEPAVLVANRGEVAIRVTRSAAGLGLRTVAVFSEDDGRCLHVAMADEARPLAGSGPVAYLDAEQLVQVARETGCQLVHPGYGFLSESADFAERCGAAGLAFVGPQADVLRALGDKTRARDLAAGLGIPVLAGTAGPTTLQQARDFLDEHGAVMVKAVAGGGGRGMAAAHTQEQLTAGFERCSSEARSAFGIEDLYVEQLLSRPRHLEIQVIGDGSGAVSHLGERDCSIQRAHQKLVELAPSPSLSSELRSRLTGAAVALAESVRYSGLGTVEFLVHGEHFWFLELNPRLQVEHTVTEAVTGLDLVEAQLRLAMGATLADLGLTQDLVPQPRGYAVQARVNLETLGADGSVRATSGTLTGFTPPSGPGVRVDTHGYAGYRTGLRFDSLLAKVVAWTPTADLGSAARRAQRALSEFAISGVETNLPVLQAILSTPEVLAGDADTGFLADHLPELLRRAAPARAARWLEEQSDEGAPPAASVEVPGTTALRAQMSATVLEVRVTEGQQVRRGDVLVVLEAMKMEHLLHASSDGVVAAVVAAVGQVVEQGAPVLLLKGDAADADVAAEVQEADLEHVPASLAEVQQRHAVGLDAARPDAVARRRKTGQRTARENLADLCDDGSLLEYGPLVVAAQRQRRSLEDLNAKTPADGLIAGIAHINGQRFPAERSRSVVLSYDYTVLAGTQGHLNHRKTDRMLELAETRRLPVVLFAEGGGGRPGDTDSTTVSGLDVETFRSFGRLSGLVPLVGVLSGRCFAGNAALLGCCDVVISTRASTVGMAGPAMIEGGGLGTFRPEEVGPSSVQWANGVIDVLVEDDAEAVSVAKRYLAYFQGDVADWSCSDQRVLRHVVPENRRRVYDIRRAIDSLADTGSVLELRAGFGAGVVTALVRIEGRPMGLIANNPGHLGGAIDRDAADKVARFLQLCEAHSLPIVSLCDTPGFMVGPEVERTATVRHFSRLFVTGANLTVPLCAVVLRKAYGLGAQAMAGGSFRAPVATVAWPTAEVGAMGLEGAVRLGARAELEAIEDPAARQAEFERLVAWAYDQGKAANAASVFELDDVIDPAETRRWLVETLAGAPSHSRPDKRVPFIDTW
jgi:acetyl/propionyl-CoA carboxylase alpha subunit/acetyl-CoA carboxylase carboxyltransferase component